MSKQFFEKLYQTNEAPWTRKEPPKPLVDMIESGKVKPGKALDIGCGEGFYSIYLARKGFDVTGFDYSEAAIEMARKNARKAGVSIKFMVMDLKNLADLKEKFDFILEWAILHGIPFEEHENYVRNVANLLTEKGKYLTSSFDIQCPLHGGPGLRRRNARSELNLYFLSLMELRSLYSKNFRIIDARTIRLKRPDNEPDNLNNVLFLEKK
jgi:2-polyprenyl-3-methyl-5-hydroxy-6-metoxy-1,4-benzoquinol methylase